MKTENSKRLRKFIEIAPLIIILVLTIMPFVLWLCFNIQVFEQNELNIAIVITPLTGILSAYIIYLSFLAQKRSSEFQFKTQKYESDLEFIFYRLSEIQDYNRSEVSGKALLSINGLISDIDLQVRHGKDIELKLVNIQNKEKDKIIELTFAVKYLNLYLIIEKKIKEIHSQIDDVQLDYICSSLIYEYTSVLKIYLETSYIPKIKKYITNGEIQENSLLREIYRKSVLLNEFVKKCPVHNSNFNKNIVSS